MPGLLSPAQLDFLARLDLAYRGPLRAGQPGERRSVRHARSPEFADFRPYVVGDDVRQVDWRAFARLERLIVRLYVAEDEAALNLIVDASGSMAAGSPSKWEAVSRLAAALGLLGLAGMDRVAVGVLGTDEVRTPFLRGRGALGRLQGFLESLRPQGGGSLPEAGHLSWTRPGTTVVLSDFLAEAGGWPALVARLARRRQRPVLWQVLTPEEERPSALGDWELVEAETDRRREVTISPALVREYLAALSEHRAGLITAAQASGGLFLATSSSAPLEAHVRTAVEVGLIRRSGR